MRIYEHLFDTPAFSQLVSIVRAGQVPCSLFGVPESLTPHLAGALTKKLRRGVVVVCASDETAAAYAEALPGALLLPHRALELRASVARSREAMFRRICALSALAFGGAHTVFAGEEAVSARLADPDDFRAAHLRIGPGSAFDPEQLMQSLVLCGYERVAAVEMAGQAARRGEILDVFCPGAVAPYRIDFFDTVVESVHTFDPATQRRGREALSAAVLPPAVELTLGSAAAKQGADALAAAKPASAALAQRLYGYAGQLRSHRYFEDIESFAHMVCRHSLFDYAAGALVVFDGYKHIREAAERREDEFAARLAALTAAGETLEGQRALYLPHALTRTKATEHGAVDLCAVGKAAELSPVSDVTFRAKSALSYNRRLDILKEDVAGRVAAGWRVYLCCGSLARAQRLSAELSDNALAVPCVENGRALTAGEAGAYPTGLLSGFELSDIKTYFLGEREIYGFARKKRRAAAGSRLDIFTDLQPGDMIVHDLHGKGRFLGLVTRTVQNIPRDYLELEYRDGDKLFIPTDQIGRVQKYMGGEGGRLSKLGGREWSQTKARVKKAVRELAEDLVGIYSERLESPGYSYGPDTLWQKQFEDAFPYEETPGQLKGIEEIKRDMQQPKVMDRLLLGDVGYGKTEVAMRACFKAVMEERQCAVLVPTTLLARQHFHTFRERFSEFAINIEAVSRYVPAADQKRILAGLAAGTVDIVIGTHRLLSPDVTFKDLGLLVIDEEQRFGVSHKERIKDLKRSVDVLTLSATPIPRTLQMALTGIRDLSMLDTPPEERKAPESYVLEYSPELLRDAIVREMSRGGQTYLVCRRIGLMDRLLAELGRHVPQARVAVAHGRMGETAMEDVMEDFLSGGYDVLLCTTIIESGIDIPSVNTVIIYEADKFGLAQLYQIKGRVGRGAKSSYAYLTYLPGAHLTPEAEKRLATIAEFTELGAGFKIAMRDLEIRGAGNLLGPEQSGQMAAVGYDMYCRLMREAVAEVKGRRIERFADTSVEIKLSAHVPAAYIGDDIQRIEIYKRIAAIDGTRSAKRLKEEIADRYGAVPRPVENLILISLIKAFASRAGFAAVTRSGRTFTLKYGEDSSVNAKALVRRLSQYPGAQLRAAEPPYIVFKAPQNTVDALLSFLHDIRRCCAGTN